VTGSALGDQGTRPMPSPDGHTGPRLLPPLLLFVGVATLVAAPVIENKLQLIDVICVAALPWLWRRVTRDRLLFLLAWTLCLWAGGQVFADWVNGLGFRLSQPLVAAITVLAITPAFVHLSGGQFRRMRYILAGMAVGLALQQYISLGNPIGSPASWKFGYNEPVSIFLLAATDVWWRRGYRIPSFLALAAICGVAYLTDHRHLFGMAVLTALLMALPRARQPHHRHHHHRAGRWVVSVVPGVVIVLAVLSGIFVQTASAGIFGMRSASQVRQFGDNPVSILVNVRPEPFQEGYLFAQRPWTGWGHQPRVDGATYTGSKQFLSSLGVVRKDLDAVWLRGEAPGVSAHSAAVDTLVRAGVWAAPFWILLVVLGLWSGTKALRLRSSPLVVLWTVLALWDSFFSPMTGLSHIQIAGFLALAVTTIGSRPRA
jgi:hypothetical protein